MGEAGFKRNQLRKKIFNLAQLDAIVICSAKYQSNKISQDRPLHKILSSGWLAISLVAATFRVGFGGNSLTDSPLFREKVVPLLIEKCFCCHGGATVEGGYSVADTSRLFLPGESAALPVSFENIEASELIVRLISPDTSVRMPLDADPLSDAEIDTMRQWLRSGAKADASLNPMSLVDIYGQFRASPRAPIHYSQSVPISALLLSHDGRFLLVGGYSEVLIWNVEKQMLDSRVPVRGRMISDLKWAPGGKFVVASGQPGKFGVLEAFDFGERKPIAAFGFSRDICTSLAASPYRDEIAAGFSDGSVTLFSLEKLKPRVVSVAHAAGVTSVEWSSIDNRIFSASLDRTAKSFESTDGKLLFAYADHERAVGGVLDTQYGPVTLDETGTLRVWSEGEEVRSLAKRDGLQQKVQRMVVANGVIYVPDKDRIRRFTIIQDEVVDEKANDKEKADEKKPIMKKRTRWKELDSMQCISSRSILSLSANPNGLIAAGLEDGQVVIWRPDDSTQPLSSWNSLP